jgi:hypothetical protein
MNQQPTPTPIYICPMHRDIRQSTPGKCPKCGMDLVPEGTRFAMLRHMIQNPVMLTIMVAVMLALMAAAMMIMR